MKFPQSVVFLLATCFIISCQKEIREDDENENPLNEGIYIRQLTILDPAKTPGKDTARKIMFSYDSEKRLSQKIVYFYYTNPSNISEIWFRSEYSFSYDGVNVNPSRIFCKHIDYDFLQPPVQDTAYLFYQNGLLVKDSVSYSYGYVEVNQFDQTGMSAYKMITRQYINGVLSSDTGYSHHTWQNGNLTYEIDSFYDNRFMPPYYIIESSPTYDNHPNPFRRINIPYPWPASVDTQLEDVLDFSLFNHPSQNNIVSILADDIFHEVEYTYKDDGLPVTALVTGPSAASKVTYRYIDL